MSSVRSISKRLRLAVLLGLGPHLTGCAVFGFVMLGPIGILSAPILAVFGWFLLPVEWAASFAQFFVYSGQSIKFSAMLIVSVVGAALFMIFFGPRDPAEGIKMIAAYAAGGASASAFSAFILRVEYQKDHGA